MPIPAAVATAITAGKVLKSLGNLGARLKSPQALHQIRVAAFAEAMQRIINGDASVATYEQGTHKEQWEPLKGLIHWAQNSARSETRAAARAILDALVENGYLEGSYPNYRYAGLAKKASSAPSGQPIIRQASYTEAADDVADIVGAVSGTRTPARGGSRTARVRKPRTYVRYDPDTGERYADITADDPRYVDWPNRKPRAARTTRSRRVSTRAPRRTKSYAEKRAGAALTRMENRVARDLARAGLSVTAAGVAQLSSMAAAAGMSLAGASALIVGAGLVSYAATTAIMESLQRQRDPVFKREQAALAYRRARIDMARRMGRELTPDEQKVLAATFKLMLDQIG